jgi:hypothetical protein
MLRSLRLRGGSARARPVEQTRDRENALLAALVELHRRKAKQARSGPADNPYARVLEHFERRGQRLHGERLVTEELIGHAFAAARTLPTAALQQELEIIGAVGATASGRFRVQNRSDAAARIEWVVGEPLEGAVPVLRFDPPALELAAGGVAMVRVTADLSTCRAAQSCCIAVECRAGGRRDRLWLTVTAFDPRVESR